MGQSEQASKGAQYLERNGDRAAWIMGSSRSGSSWLLRMLTGLDQVSGIDDPHIAHHLSTWRPLPLAWAVAGERPSLTTLRDVKHDKRDYFFSDAFRDSWVPALGELIRARFGAQLAEDADLSERPFLVVKEPGSCPADALLAAIPDAKLIFLLRDGRDVVDSWVDAYRDGSWAVEEGAFAAAPDSRLALVEWLSAVWAFRTGELMKTFTRLDPDRRVLVRYEDLLRRPAQQLRRVCSLMGITVTGPRLEQLAARHGFGRVPLNERGSLREIRRAKPGGWRTNLDPDEQAAMYEIMGEQLAILGYEAEDRAAA